MNDKFLDSLVLILLGKVLLYRHERIESLYPLRSYRKDCKNQKFNDSYK